MVQPDDTPRTPPPIRRRISSRKTEKTAALAQGVGPQRRSSRRELDFFLANAEPASNRQQDKDLLEPPAITPNTSGSSFDSPEPSLDTARAGNVTTNTSSVLLTSLVCLSLLEGQSSRSKKATMDRTQSWGRMFWTTPERMVRETLARHFQFHLSRHQRLENRLGSSDSTTSSSSSPARNNKNMNDSRKGASTIHVQARECLQNDETYDAISLYKGLLEKQPKRVDAQRADTLSVLTVLCLSCGRNAEALKYSSEALELHRDNERPLQEAVSAMEVGLVHFGANKLGKALRLWREAMQLACMSMGYDHPHVAVLLNNIGVLHHESGDAIGSVRALEESLELQRKMMSNAPIHLENALYQLATTMGNLAIACERRNQYDRAIQQMEESLSLYGSIFDADTSDLENIVNENIERLTKDRANHKKWGKPERTLELSDSESHASSVDSQRSASLFGNSDGIPNKRAAALLTLEVSDNFDFILLGPLAEKQSAEQRVRDTVLTWFGRMVDADRVGGTCFVAFDDTPPESARPKESIPVDLDGQTVVNAEQHLKQINAQAMLHLDHHEIDDALDLFHSALRSHQEKYGKKHHLVGSALHNIGMVHFFAKSYDQALKGFKKAVKVRIKALGPNHPDVAHSMMKIGLVHLATGNLADARSIFAAIREKYLNVLGYRHPQMAKIVNNLGVVQYQYGDLDYALRSFEIAHEYQRKLVEDSEGDKELVELALANTLSNIGFVYAEAREFLESLQVYEEAVALLKKHLDDDDPRVVSLQKNIDFVVANGKPATECIPPPVSTSCLFNVFLCGQSDNTANTTVRKGNK